MSQRSVKWLIHLFQFAPLKSGMTTSIWRQEGTHGTKTRTRARICLRDGSCGSGDHPSDHDAQFGRAELVTDVPSSTFAFVLRRSTSLLPPTLDTLLSPYRHRRAAVSLIRARYHHGGPIMKKLGVLGIIAGAAFLMAVPLSIEWSQKTAAPTLTLSQAEAQTAGMQRRETRRSARRAGRETRRAVRRGASPQ